MSYIVPSEELTLTDKKQLRNEALEAGIARALKLGLASSREGLIAREPENIADFGTAADQWLTAALTAVGTLFTVFNNIATPTLANNKLVVFYKVGVETAPSPVSLLWFQLGAAAGTTKAVFDLEQLVNHLVVEGYFNEPVVYDPTNVLNVRVTCRILTNLQARVQLGGFLVEPRGQVIS